MCGIAGIVCRKAPGPEWLSTRIKCMTDTIIHRGPDGEGHYLAETFALGHRRLAIIDLSEAAAQPMTWNNSFTITYNGEVYNYIEIREELRNYGYQFQTQSDTEVILAAYHKWGEDCVKRFNGMWAFAIHDNRRNLLFCSRDRFGVKPFYYTDRAGIFAFGSEIREILALQIESPKLNRAVAINYLVLNMMDHDEKTFFNEIYKLPGGHNLVYNLDTCSFTIKRYYEISFRPEIRNISEKEALEYYAGEFTRSIKYRLRSDVKVGTCLSGGLDSSSVAATASLINRERNAVPFCAITGQSTQKEYDESDYASQVVDAFGLDWYLTKPTREEFLSILDDVINTQEYPFIGPTVYMQYFVMKKAKESGITVLLDGQGGDESLLGYRRYVPAIIRSFGMINFLFIMGSIRSNYSISYKEIIKNLIYFSSPSFRKFRQLNAFKTLEREHIKLLNTPLLNEYAKAYRDIFKLQKLEFTSTQVPSLLRFEDKNSMRHSVETRLPFLDWELVELSLSLPTSMKLHNGWSKYILRQYAESISMPTDIAWRKTKLGFNAPVEDWLEGMNDEMNNTIVKSPILNELFSGVIQKQNMDQRWRMYNFAKWERCFHISI